MKILVSYDGSPCSREAVHSVASMSLPPGSRILVVNVIEDFSRILPIPIFEKEPIDLEIDKIEHSLQLQGVVDMLSRQQPHVVVQHKVRFGLPVEMILDTAYSWKPDLVVIGAKGRGQLDRLLLGSVSHSVLERLDCPVLIKRPGRQPKKQSSCRKILLPVDGSLFSFDTIEWLAGQEWSAGSCFRLFMAIPEFKDLMTPQVSRRKAAVLQQRWQCTKERAFEMLEEQALKLGTQVGNDHISIEVEPGEPGQAILQAAARWSPDIIAMGSHGRTGLESILVGSVSKYVTTHFAGSVLVVRRLSKSALGHAQKRELRLEQQEDEEWWESHKIEREPEYDGAVPHFVYKP
ncbi:MAG: universal stress protein [Cyanobacteria bacterium]|nr:universal stress protein [Cyanobacteriota bacterium]